MNALWSDYQDGPDPGGLADLLLIPFTILVSGTRDDGSVVPSTGGETSFDSDVATSRFWFKTATPTMRGTVSSNIELDFIVSV